MNLSLLMKRLAAITCAWLIGTSPLYACTGLALKAEDGTYVSGRTAEFGRQLDLNILYIPRHIAFHGTLPNGKAGIKYVSKYATIGADAYGERSLLDGLNEKGLAVAGFYFPGYASYPQVTAENKDKGLSPTEFPTWALTQFADRRPGEGGSEERRHRPDHSPRLGLRGATLPLHRL